MNVFAQFLRLLPQTPTYVGTVTSTTGSGSATWATVQVAGSGLLHARGECAVGQRVFVRDGVVQGQAPVLTYAEAQV